MANGIKLSGLRRMIKKESVVYTRNDVFAAWRNAPAESAFQPNFLDRKEYVGLPQGVWDQVLIHLGIHKFSYESDRSDCDDFALAVRGRAPLELKVNGVGAVIDYSGGHGYNAFVISVPSGQVPEIKFVEPQRKSPSTWWVREPGKDGMYDLDIGYVVF